MELQVYRHQSEIMHQQNTKINPSIYPLAAKLYNLTGYRQKKFMYPMKKNPSPRNEKIQVQGMKISKFKEWENLSPRNEKI